MTTEANLASGGETEGGSPAAPEATAIPGEPDDAQGRPLEPVDERERYKLPSRLLIVGILTTLVAVASGWTSGDPTLHQLLDAPSNGWIPLLSSILAIAVYPRFRVGRWPAIVAILLVSLAALSRVTATQALVNFERTWGWWVGLAGAGLLVASAGFAAVLRIADRRHPRFQRPRGLRQIGGVVVLTVGIVGLWVLGQLLIVSEVVSWPPSAAAATADEAQEATESFAAENRAPLDLSMEYAWSTADTIEVRPEGVDFFPRIFADIEQAESSIHILMFGWKSGEVGTELAALIEAKLAEGVDVRIVVDGIGSSPYDESIDMYQRLADAGAEIVVNDSAPIDEDAAALLSIPVSDSNRNEVGRAEHRKLYIIDGEVVWTGGAGIEDHFRNGEFHDVMVRVTGDIVRQVQAVFLTTFASHDAPLPADLSVYFPEPSSAGTTPIAVVQTVPGGFSSATQQVREMIDNAEERLDVMNPYLTDEGIVDRLVQASERGVDVRVVVSEESNNASAQRATEYFYSRLLDSGVEVWEYPDAVVHAKLVVADDTAHFGTLNLDAWSLYRDFEVALVAESPEVADMFRERVFEPDVEISTLAEKPSADQRFVNWVFYKLTWFL